MFPTSFYHCETLGHHLMFSFLVNLLTNWNKYISNIFYSFLQRAKANRKIIRHDRISFFFLEHQSIWEIPIIKRTIGTSSAGSFGMSKRIHSFILFAWIKSVGCVSSFYYIFTPILSSINALSLFILFVVSFVNCNAYRVHGWQSDVCCF